MYEKIKKRNKQTTEKDFTYTQNKTNNNNNSKGKVYC